MSNDPQGAGFQPGVPSNALTSLIAKGVRQHLKAKGVEVKHTDILTGVAKALGFENANALRALAETGDDPRGSLPAKHASYFRTRYVFDVLAEDAPLTTPDLSEIHYETDEGACVGHMRTVHVTPLSAREMHEALLAAGNDGAFFESLVEADEGDGDAEEAADRDDGSHGDTTDRTLDPAGRALLRLACHVDERLQIEARPRATMENAWKLARELQRRAQPFTVEQNGHSWDQRVPERILESCDPQGALRNARMADLPDQVIRVSKRFPEETTLPEVLATCQPGIQATLAAHGPRHIQAASAMPLVTRLLAQEMRNAVNAGEEPTLREAYDSVRQCGENLWADIDPGVEMVRLDADDMIALLKALVEQIGGEADIETLLRQEGIANPYTHRSESSPATHRPDGDRPVIQLRQAYLVEVTYLPGHDQPALTRGLLVATDSTGAAQRTATRLMAGHPTAAGARVTSLSVTEPVQEADKITHLVSLALRRICDHLTREADYALTLDRVREFVQTHSAEALEEIVGRLDEIWTRDMLVAELAALAATAPIGWADEQTVARLA